MLFSNEKKTSKANKSGYFTYVVIVTHQTDNIGGII